jgi:hypothetical protein
MEPVRPMNQPTVNQTVQHGSRFSFSSPQGKKNPLPVITTIIRSGSFTRTAKSIGASTTD